MADFETAVTIDELTDAIVAGLRAAFPAEGEGAIITVAAYPDERVKVATPAILVECIEMQPGTDPGTDQTSLDCRFEARVLVSGYESAPRKAVRSLAAAVAHVVRQNRWGLTVAPAELIGAFPDDWRPEREEYDVWRVEWNQTCHIGGASIWAPDPDAVTPSEVYVGLTPDIGPEHIDDYVQVTDD